MLCPICAEPDRASRVSCPCDADLGHRRLKFELERACRDRSGARVLLPFIVLFTGTFALKARVSDCGQEWTVLQLIGTAQFWAAILLYRDAQRRIAMTLASWRPPGARVVRRGRTRR